MKKDNDKLIKGCLKGNRQAQKALYNAYKAQMYGLCLRYGKSQNNAEDILQEGFIKVYRDLHQYKPLAPLGAWIRKVMVNTALEHIRREKRNISAEDSADYREIPAAQENPSGELEAKQLIEIIQELQEEYRLVFNLYAIEGYAHNEIADMLNISESNSKVRLNRARKMIQEMLEKHFETKQ